MPVIFIPATIYDHLRAQKTSCLPDKCLSDWLLSTNRALDV